MIQFSCCIPGGSLMPEGVREVPDSPAGQIVEKCRYLLSVGFNKTECAGGMLADLTPEDADWLVEENAKSSLELVAVNAQPAGDTDFHVLDLLELRRGLALFLDLDDIAGLHLIGRNVDDLAVDHVMTMVDKLSGFSSCGAQPHSVDDVVKSFFQHDQQVFTGDALLVRRLLKCISELLFKDAVDELRSLLLTELETVFAHLLVLISMRRSLRFFEDPHVAGVDLQGSASFQNRISINCHVLVPPFNQTLLLLGGLHPLCGMGVMSLIIVICRPAV